MTFNPIGVGSGFLEPTDPIVAPFQRRATEGSVIKDDDVRWMVMTVVVEAHHIANIDGDRFRVYMVVRNVHHELLGENRF